MRTVLLMLWMALLTTGCASYEYDLVAPQALARHIGEQIETLPRDPLVYQAQSYDDHLVLRIGNPGDVPVTLLGHESFLVDPSGESHPLRPLTIGPQSFIKLILPPLATNIEPRGPSVGIGVGYNSNVGGGVRIGAEPTYVAVSSIDGTFWRWEPGRVVRMTLVFERRGKAFQHSFEFRRIKM